MSTLSGEVLDSKMLFPIVGQALVEGAVYYNILLEWCQMGLVLLNSSSDVFISLIFLVFSSFSSSSTSSILATVFPLPLSLPRHLLLPTKTIIDRHIWCIYLTYFFFFLGDGELNEMNPECFFTISLIFFSSRYSTWSSLRNRRSSVPRLRGWLTVLSVIVKVSAAADSQIYRSSSLCFKITWTYS